MSPRPVVPGTIRRGSTARRHRLVAIAPGGPAVRGACSDGQPAEPPVAETGSRGPAMSETRWARELPRSDCDVPAPRWMRRPGAARHRQRHRRGDRDTHSGSRRRCQGDQLGSMPTQRLPRPFIHHAPPSSWSGQGHEGKVTTFRPPPRRRGGHPAWPDDLSRQMGWHLADDVWRRGFGWNHL